jgi:YidC/Oxa1 family membrane protein insertase
MSSLFGIPVDAAYHIVSALAAGLTPVTGGLAAAAAIVVFTMAVRLLLMPLSYRGMRGMNAQSQIAPKVAELRQRHSKQPEILQRELVALYQAEGTSMFAGCLPMLIQWPFLSVMYLLFRSARVAGGPNGLLTHELFGAPLASHWLSGPGPFSLQGAVFAGLFVLLGIVGWLSTRVTRRLTAAAAGRAGGSGASSGGPASGLPASGAPTSGVPALAASSTATMTRLMPYLTMVFAAFLPLAAGLYLVTTTAWTLAERVILRRRLAAAPVTA